MKFDKKSIIALIIFLLILLIVILVYGKKDNKDNNEIPHDEYSEYYQNRERAGISAKDAVAQEVSNMNEYMTIKGIITKFSENVLYLNATADDLDLIVDKEQEASVLAEYKQEGLTFIKEVLAPNYKEKYSVDDTYIMNSLSKYAKAVYVVKDMYAVYDSEYLNTFFVYGSYGNEEYNFIVILDRYTSSFALYLNNYVKEQGYSADNKDSMKTLNITKVESNESNSFQYKNVEKEQVAKLYYEEFLQLAKSNPTAAYAKLDSDYKSKRFKSVEEFTNYVGNLPTGTQAKIATYTITEGNSYTEYLCKDMLGNNFIFKVTGAMKYTVILDTYTVKVLAYQNEYDKLEDNKKVELCLNRFFEAINNQDYEKAYSYLNETFRTNNFGSVEEFKKYVTTYWFKVNNFIYQSTETSTNGTYSVYGIIQDYEQDGNFDAGLIDKTFYVKLGDSYDSFEVSFEK
ncbi:MAG: hypothetical protein IKE91_08605 [Clostridia bacterium]|nr:hypothetical protein [Clostridia bacterium]